MTIDRRKFITVTGSAISSAILASCDSRGPRSAEKLLRYAERKNEVLERALMRHTAMDAPVAGARLAGKALPSYFISRTVPIWDETSKGQWALEVGGLVKSPMRLTLDDLLRLPRTTERVNHYCVEGWTAVEQWTGVRVRELARLVGVDRRAQ
ncbi:MAG TPA: molybdopterin-dependent oxidoreductase, partial [Gemmatimonadaceae bacterium]|nr:molybdopterin-dependent oxidoreductase [Gemmatimonadaceae bacterium]